MTEKDKQFYTELLGTIRKCMEECAEIRSRYDKPKLAQSDRKMAKTVACD